MVIPPASDEETARDCTPRRSMDAAVLLAAAALPAAAWVYKVFLHPRPFWIMHYDPEALYFYGALSLAHGEGILMVDHPGIPVHLIGALLLKLTGWGPLDFDAFRLAGYCTAAALWTAGAWLLLRTLLRKLPPPLKVAALWAYALHPLALEYAAIWSPEMFFFPAGALALAAISGLAEGFSPRRAFLAGAAVGLCTGLKFTFLGFLTALLLALLAMPGRPWREKLQDAGAAFGGWAAGFLAATIAAASQYGRMAARMSLLYSRGGRYGEGPPATLSLEKTAGNLLNLLRGQDAPGDGFPIWSAWLVLAALALAAGLWASRRRGRIPPRTVFLTVFTAAAAAATLLSVAVRSPVPRYALPLGVTGILLAALALEGLPGGGRTLVRWAALSVTGMALCAALTRDLRRHVEMIRHGRMERRLVEQALSAAGWDPGSDTVVYGWRIPQPSFALRFMVPAMIRGPLRQRVLAEIESAYPREGHIYGRVMLPAGSPAWDFLVMCDHPIPGPQGFIPTGRVLDRAGPFVIIGRPDTRSP